MKTARENWWKQTTLANRMKILRKLMDEHDKLTAKLKPVDEQIEKLRNGIIDEFTSDELKSVTAAGLRVARVATSVPTMKDLIEFYKYASRKPNWDLLQKTVNTPAWRERIDAKKPVPGVEPFVRISLSVTRVNKKPK